MGSYFSTGETDDDLTEKISKFDVELQCVLQKYQNSIDTFLKEYNVWLQKRTEVIESLKGITHGVETHHQNVNIASLTGSSVSLVGGAACIAGLVCAPFTGGLSVALSVGGLIGSTAGTVTMTGAHLVEAGLKADALKKAQKFIEEDCKETVHLISLIKCLQMYEDEIQSLFQNSELISFVKDNVTKLSKNVTNSVLKEKLKNIENGEETSEDYIAIMNLLRTDSFNSLQKLQHTQRHILKLDVIQGTQCVSRSLRSSVQNIRKCSVFLKEWQTGVNALSALSKASRFGKGMLIGLSMVFDAYEIGSTAKEMIRKEKFKLVKALQEIITELEDQKKEIADYCIQLSSSE